MAATSEKRALPVKVAAMRAKKRRKLDGDDAEPQAKRLPAKRKGGQNVRPDDLTWKDVAMPDRIDDFEGFFGLEEIDDVNVVRDSTGMVQYVQAGDHANYVPGSVDGSDGEKDLLDDEPWGGFGDDLGDGVTQPEASVPSVIALDKQKSQKKEKKIKPVKKKTKGDDSMGSGVTSAFNDLMEESPEDADISAWQTLNLSPDTLAALARLKFSKPTPIQSAAIPEILAGHDVIGKASTGSGKTLAFGIPIFERFLEQQLEHTSGPKGVPHKAGKKAALALILSPTRELAHQLSTHLNDLCSGLPGKSPLVATITGGLSVQKQQRVLQTADIVIGTPGRLWEVISGGQGIMQWLKKVQYLVIDEADRLLSQGHFKEVEEILNVLDRKEAVEGEEDDETPHDVDHQRQTLVFSATFHKGLSQKLAGKSRPGGISDKTDSMEYLLAKLKFREEKPKYLDMNPVRQMATGLREGLVECAGTEKDLYLYSLLLLHSKARTLVFTNSISAVRRLTPFLQNLQLPVLPLHSQMAQKARMRSIERFTGTASTPASANTGSILVATDVAARGLHIPNIQLVIHYHLPRAADTYVHRSGRTARAGETGSSILICGPEEVVGVRRLVAKVHASTAATTAKSAREAAKSGYFIRSLDIDRRVVARLKPRATLAKQLADVTGAKEKKHSEDDFMRKAAEELGVEYDSEEFEKQANGKRGRGAGRLKKEREARSFTKDEVYALRAELGQLLKQRVNVGVSERYLTAGDIDIDELLKQGDGVKGEFLGAVNGIGLDD